MVELVDSTLTVVKIAAITAMVAMGAIARDLVAPLRASVSNLEVASSVADIGSPLVGAGMR
jgi:hypothetical protein